MLRIWCSILHQFPKGVLPSLNSSYFFIKSFFLFPSQTFCSPSHSLISYFSTYCAKTPFDFKTLFKNHLIQSARHFFCEVGHISHFHKFQRPCSNILSPYLMHGLYDFIVILFDDYCKYVFDPGGTFKSGCCEPLTNPLDLRTDPLQEGGDNVIPTRPIAWAISQAHFSYFLYF